MIIEVVDCLGFRLIAFLSFPVPLFSYFSFDKSYGSLLTVTVLDSSIIAFNSYSTIRRDLTVKEKMTLTVT